MENGSTFRNLFESFEEIVVVSTPDGKVLYANNAIERVLGYTVEDLQQMHLLELNPENHRAEAEEIFASMVRGERDVCPLPVVAKSGKIVPVETRVWFGKWDDKDAIFGIIKLLNGESEANQRFERLFRNNPALMAVSSLPERRFIDVNNTFLSVLGYSRAEVIGKTSAELNLAFDKAKHDSLAALLKDFKQFSNKEMMMRRKDGGVIYGLFSGETIVSQGKPCYLTVMIDISERKRFEFALIESEERYRTLFERNKTVKLLIDPKSGMILEANSAASTYYGYDHSEILQKNVSDINTLTPSEIAQELALAELEQQECFHFKHRLANGEIRDVEVHTSPINYQGRNLLYSNIYDVTERKVAERKLVTEHKKLVNVIEGTQAGTWEWNVQTGETVFNERWAEILGYKLSELEPISINTWLQLAHPDDLQLSNELLAKHFAGETQFYDSVCRMKHKEGHWVWIHDRGVVVDWSEDHKPLKMYGTHTDITEVKQQEKRLQNTIDQLNDALDQIKTLRGILPICCVCKKIRDDQGYWNQVEVYVSKHTDAEFTHGMCPECAQKTYPELFDSPS
ncbi:MAG: PAS domain-containing protein [bacterium]|nr:PAS domain-containing protein [bacterium]